MDSRQHCRSMKLVKAAQLNQPIPIVHKKYQTPKKVPSIKSHDQTIILNNLVFKQIMSEKDNVGVKHLVQKNTYQKNLLIFQYYT